jgi:hypothetical protein
MRAAVLAIAACNPGFHFTAFDPAKASALRVQAAVTIDDAVPFCGATALLPPVAVTMADGKLRATANVPPEDLLDAAELVWTANVGGVRLVGGNRFVFDAGADYFALLDTDVALTVALARNRTVTAQLALVPSYRCNVTADFAGATGPEGAQGFTGEPGSDERLGRPGRGGGPGRRGARGPTVDVAMTMVGSAKRGELVYARVTASDGRAGSYVFSPQGGRLFVSAVGGAGGRGGRGGTGGHGGNGTSRSNVCRAPGEGGPGGRGGDGGDAGDGGEVVVRIDRAYPQLGDLVSVAVEGGRGGEPGEAGDGGRGGQPTGTFQNDQGTTLSCSSKERDGARGEPGSAGDRRGRDGRPGHSQVVLESLVRMFPEGVNLHQR